MKFFELQILGELFVGKNLNKYLWIIVVVCLGFLFLTRSGGFVDGMANPDLLTYTVTEAGEGSSTYSVTVQFRGEASYAKMGSADIYEFELNDPFVAELKSTLSRADVSSDPVVDPAKDMITLTTRYWDRPVTWNAGQLPDELADVAENLERILDSH